MRVLTRLRPGPRRLVVLNSVAIVATFVVLAASPAPVHFPSTHREAVLLAAAAVLFLFANLALAGTAVWRSIERGRTSRTETAELAPATAD